MSLGETVWSYDATTSYYTTTGINGGIHATAGWYSSNQYLRKEDETFLRMVIEERFSSREETERTEDGYERIHIKTNGRKTEKNDIDFKFNWLLRSVKQGDGKGYTKSNLYNFYSFYKLYPDIFQTVSGKSFALLSWSHYTILLQVREMNPAE